MANAKEFDYITYEEFLCHQETINADLEYSNGYIYYMSPTHPNHNKVQNRIFIQLSNILGDCSGSEVFTSDVAVKFDDGDIKHQFEPDVMVACDNNFDGSIYAGISTLIVEILSRATKDRDLGLKLDVYEKFGVKEYWIVDIAAKEITVYSNHIHGKYHSKIVYDENMTIKWNDEEIKVSNLFVNLI